MTEIKDYNGTTDRVETYEMDERAKVVEIVEE